MSEIYGVFSWPSGKEVKIPDPGSWEEEFDIGPVIEWPDGNTYDRTSLEEAKELLKACREDDPEGTKQYRIVKVSFLILEDK